MHHNTMHDTHNDYFVSSAYSAPYSHADGYNYTDGYDRCFWLCEQELHFTTESPNLRYYGILVEKNWVQDNRRFPQLYIDTTHALIAKRDEGYNRYRRLQQRKVDFKDKMRRNMRRETFKDRPVGGRSWDDFISMSTREVWNTRGKEFAKAISSAIHFGKLSLKDPAMKKVATEHFWTAYWVEAKNDRSNRVIDIANLQFDISFGAMYDANTKYDGRFVGNELIQIIRQEMGVVNAAWPFDRTPESEKVLPYHVEAFIHSCHVHISDTDPVQIAYAPSYEYLAKDRFVRTTVGKFLTKYFRSTKPGEFSFTEVQIRNIANAYTLKHTPPELHLVPVTDPDMWEWVYEHGTGFTSCMTYDRDPGGRYLAEEASGPNHPVRAYAHPDSKLKLAWIGIPGKEVWARAVVNDSDPDNKMYVRCYGDDRLRKLLDQKGYKNKATEAMIGQPVRIMPHPTMTDAVFLPYLDGGCLGVAKPTKDADHFVFADCNVYHIISGQSSGVSSTRGVKPMDEQSEKHHDNERTCDCCGENDDEDEMTYIEHDDQLVCQGCIDNDYVYGYVARHRNMGYMHQDDAVSCEGDGSYYREILTGHYGLVHVEGHGWYRTEHDDIVFIHSRDAWFLMCDVIQLDYEHHDSDSGMYDEYARSEDVVEDSNGNAMHEDDAVMSDLSNDQWFHEHIWVLQDNLNNDTYRFHPDEVKDFLDDLFVVEGKMDGDKTPVKLFYIPEEDRPDIGPAMRTLRDYLMYVVKDHEGLEFDNITEECNATKQTYIFDKLRKELLAQAAETKPQADERFAIAA